MGAETVGAETRCTETRGTDTTTGQVTVRATILAVNNSQNSLHQPWQPLPAREALLELSTGGGPGLDGT